MKYAIWPDGTICEETHLAHMLTFCSDDYELVEEEQYNRLRARWDADEFFMGLARRCAQESPDPSTKVGFVIVKNGAVKATGFNRFPKDHPDDPALYADRTYKYQHILHAEDVALDALEPNETLIDCVGYSSFPVCPECMAKLADRGLKHVVQPPLPVLGRPFRWVQEWRAKVGEALDISYRKGVTIKIHSACGPQSS